MAPSPHRQSPANSSSGHLANSGPSGLVCGPSSAPGLMQPAGGGGGGAGDDGTAAMGTIDYSSIYVPLTLPAAVAAAATATTTYSQQAAYSVQSSSDPNGMKLRFVRRQQQQSQSPIPRFTGQPPQPQPSSTATSFSQNPNQYSSVPGSSWTSTPSGGQNGYGNANGTVAAVVPSSASAPASNGHFSTPLSAYVYNVPTASFTPSYTQPQQYYGAPTAAAATSTTASASNSSSSSSSSTAGANAVTKPAASKYDSYVDSINRAIQNTCYPDSTTSTSPSSSTTNNVSSSSQTWSAYVYPQATASLLPPPPFTATSAVVAAAAAAVNPPIKRGRGRPPTAPVRKPRVPKVKKNLLNIVSTSNSQVNHSQPPYWGTTPFPSSAGAVINSYSVYPYQAAAGIVSNQALPSTSSGSNNNNPCDPPPAPTAEPPMPPSFQERIDSTILNLKTFITFPVDPNSLEFAGLTALLDPVEVISAEQILNPDLWSRFRNMRKEMLRSKSDDLELLSKLGLEEKDVMRAAHLSYNFTKDAILTAVPYSDNMVLLFHCTKSQASLDAILNQGLDERMSNLGGGLLGRGIYFSDSPLKALQYDGGTGSILVFAVLLGDCLSVDDLANRGNFVREPEKVTQQKRNFNDQFFDSIVAQPGSGRDNEFVIYNRYQCCPLYLVKYNNSHYGHQQRKTRGFSPYVEVRKALPPIAWKPTGGMKGTVSMPNHPPNTGYVWPYYAALVFEQMGVTTVQKTNPSSAAEVIDITDTPDADDPDLDIIRDEKLATLISLGFTDEEENRRVLEQFKYNLDQAINHLLDQQSSSSSPSPVIVSVSSTSASTAVPSTSTNVSGKRPRSAEGQSKSTAGNKSAKTKPSDIPEDIVEWALSFDLEYLPTGAGTVADSDNSPPPPPTAQITMEECPICCDEFESPSPSWSELSCSHKVCTTCFKQIEKTATTMSGVTHVSVRCPFCQGLSGTEIGTCPDGKMTVAINRTDCEGYPGVGTIRIIYSVSGRFPLNRTAYLPNNKEGQEILALLRTAWDRRLCFVIGTSVTTGQENVLVWNIHHKTSPSGGVANYGYPDPSYFDRVKLELKAYGIV